MKKLIIFFPLILLSLAIVFPPSAFADQTLLSNADCFYREAATLDCVAPLFANLVYWLMVLSGTVAIFLIIIGGIKFLTSGGDQQKVAGAKNTLTWAIVGLVVILSSFMIVNIIADLTGVNCITKFGFNSCGLPENNTCGGNSFGPCANEDKVCIGADGNYSCQFLCSKDYHGSNAYCSQGDCVKINETNWGCRPPCNKTNKTNGFCDYPQTCQKTASGDWKCKLGGR